MEKPHKKLDVWKLAMDLVIDVYKITEIFPKDERFPLTDQIRRSAISIPSNIAEGAVPCPIAHSPSPMTLCP